VLAHARALAPIWWALRGYLAVAAFALVNDQMVEAVPRHPVRSAAPLR
jgi:hypothetical protein